MNITDEVYTLEQLRKMNCLDGNKKLVFLSKVNEYIDEREHIHQVNLECARVGAKGYILEKAKQLLEDIRKDRCDCENISELYDKCYMCELIDKKETELGLE